MDSMRGIRRLVEMELRFAMMMLLLTLIESLAEGGIVEA